MKNTTKRLKNTAKKFTLILACFIFLSASTCYSQSPCLKLRVDLLLSRESNVDTPINNGSISSRDMSWLFYQISYYNCEETDLTIRSRALLSNNDNFGNSVSPNYCYLEISSRVYVKKNGLYVFFSDLFTYIPSRIEGLYTDSTEYHILKPHEMYRSSGQTEYFTPMPAGEYEVYFDYMCHFPDDNKSKRFGKDNRMVADCFCSENCNYKDGFYFQTAVNKISFKVVP